PPQDGRREGQGQGQEAHCNAKADGRAATIAQGRRRRRRRASGLDASDRRRVEGRVEVLVAPATRPLRRPETGVHYTTYYEEMKMTKSEVNRIARDAVKILKTAQIGLC